MKQEETGKNIEKWVNKLEITGRNRKRMGKNGKKGKDMGRNRKTPEETQKKQEEIL